MRQTGSVTWTGSAVLPGWVLGSATPSDAAELTDLLRRHEERARGWASATAAELSVALSGSAGTARANLVVRDGEGAARGWGSTHDRAAGRMLLVVVVDPLLDGCDADAVARTLFDWGDATGQQVGSGRGLQVQQVDSGAFAQDERQHRWLERAGYRRVRTWWQMSRPVQPGEAALPVLPGVRIRRVVSGDDGMPDEADLRTVHDILEDSFADHFNSHEETFDEFVVRLQDDPGHRWDHWWIAELLEDAVAVGALVGSVSDGGSDRADGTYIDYVGVLPAARGRGVAKGLLRTVIADAAALGRDRVDLEVDADSPTGAEGLYVSMGWRTRYVTESWHKEVRVGGR
jgi:ribosomal protein S18 acetylase RimI-like enzyme